MRGLRSGTRRAVIVRAVLFDFDFTLGDSAEAIVHCSRAAFADMGLEPAAPPAIRRTIGLTLQESFRVLIGGAEALAGVVASPPAEDAAEEYRRCTSHTPTR